ncbi:motility protein A [Thioalkalivibrio sp.]|uniref:motility protein A n=1 Tax=Thioalkalivibrio sp. TaxID=2093813 RepID=UPI003563C4E9
MRRKLYFGLTLLGTLAVAALLWLSLGLSGVNLPGLALVLGGTLLASVIGHSPGPVLSLLRRIPVLFRETQTSTAVDYKPFLQIAERYRRGDVRGAEQAATAIQDPFLRGGTRLALDPHNGEELGRMLHWRIRQQKEDDHRDIRILRTMATFAPAFGMLGTLFGLVAMLGSLGQSGLEHIGMAMGFALMSTLYGLLIANLVFRPLALKLEDRSRQQLLHMNMLVDAIMMLYERQHPVLIGEFMGAARPEPEPGREAPKGRSMSLQGMRA